MSTTKTKTRKPKRDVAEEVTNRVIESLEAGTVPWRRPWTVKPGDMHRNYVSNKPYRGINPFMLDMVAMVEGYSSAQWLTFDQAAAQSFRQYCKSEGLPMTKGGKPNPDSMKAYKAAIEADPGTYKGVRKGQKGTTVIWWYRNTFTPTDDDGNPILDKNGNPKVVPYAIPKPWKVFNTEQTGLPAEAIVEDGEAREHTPHEDSEAVIERLRAEKDLDLTFHGSRAYHMPADNSVHVPEPEVFESGEAFYHTLYHELTHWTKAPNRLNRTEPDHGGFGSKGYAREELTAELGAAIVTHTLGIANPEIHEQEAAYIAGWLKALKNDKSLIVKAGSKAQAAADYILGVEYGKDGEDK